MYFCIISRFPKLLSKISCDEQELREKIDRAIRNTNGVRPCLNTPQTAFESIVQQEISRLNKPIRECVDLVVNLLLDAVRACTQSVSCWNNLSIDSYVECNLKKSVRYKKMYFFSDGTLPKNP